MSTTDGHHSPSPLTPGTLAIYVLVTLGAVFRVAASALPQVYLKALVIGGALWSAAFGLFVISYARILLRPRVGRT